MSETWSKLSREIRKMFHEIDVDTVKDILRYADEDEARKYLREIGRDNMMAQQIIAAARKQYEEAKGR